MIWRREWTIKRLLADRHGIGISGYLEMVALIAAIAIALGFLERAI